MLHHLHDGGRVVPLQPAVAVQQRAVQQLHPPGRPGAGAVEPQAPLRHLQRPQRHVDADQFALELNGPLSPGRWHDAQFL